MGIVDRAKNIIITPKTEWDVIAAESTPQGAIITGYVLPLAAIAALAGFIGMVFVGISVPLLGTTRIGIVWGVVSLIYTIAMAVVMVFVCAFIIDALAPTFGAQKSMPQAVKVAAYSFTPVWVASVVKIVPLLGILVIIAAIYAIYVLYLGLMHVMKAPQEKAAGYTALVIVAAIIVAVVVGIIGSMLMTPALIGGAALGVSSSPALSHEKDSGMAKLDQFARKMEEAGKKMEAAQKSGDPAKQMEAAVAALGTAVSGGKAVEPITLEQLKPLVPDKLADLPRTDIKTERGGMAGFTMARAEARYGDPGGKHVALEIMDTGGVAGLMGFASWMGIQGEREDAARIERTRKEGTRMVHEEIDKTGGNNEYSIVLKDRFVVSAKGTADINALKSAVDSLDLAKLEGMK